MGRPFEKGLRTCIVADSLAVVLGLDAQDRRVVFDTALLRSVGCTSSSSESASLFGDEFAFGAAVAELDPGDPEVFSAQMAAFGSWAGPAQGRLAERFIRVAPVAGPRAILAACEVSRALGPRLGLAPAAVAALDEVNERWDGLGLPAGRAGEALSLAARIVHVAECAVLGYLGGGRAAALRRGEQARRWAPRPAGGGRLRDPRRDHPGRPERTGPAGGCRPRRAGAGHHRAAASAGRPVPIIGHRCRPQGTLAARALCARRAAFRVGR